MGRRPQPEATRLTVHIGTKLTIADAAVFEARCKEHELNEHTAVRTAVLQWLGAVSPLDPAVESAVEAAVERGVRKALKVRGALAAAVAEVEVDAVEAEELAALGAALLERRESRAKLAARLGCDTKTINEWIDGDPRRRRMTTDERAALGLPPRQLELMSDPGPVRPRPAVEPLRPAPAAKRAPSKPAAKPLAVRPELVTADDPRP